MDAHLIAAELRRQHARIAELEAELEAVGAGGVQALSAAPAEVMKWPKDASEVREFMHTHCITEQYAVGIESPSDDDKYLLSAHDFLSAVNWWADFPHYQAASPTPPALSAAPAVDIATVGEAQAFEAWYKQDCVIEGAAAKMAAKAAWKARAMLAAAPTPTAEQPIGELVVTKTKDGQIVSVTRQDDEGRILSVIATSDPVEQQATPDGEPSNVELRGLWRGAGGSFHGPSVETGTMPEAKLLPFLRSLLRKQAAPKAAPSEGGDETDWYHGITEKHFDRAVQKAVQRDRASRAAAPKAAPGEPTQEFEKWLATYSTLSAARDVNGYADLTTEMLWHAWQAAAKTKAPEGASAEWIDANARPGLALTNYACAHDFSVQPSSGIRLCQKCGISETAARKAAPQQEAQEPCPSCKNSDIYACTCTFQTSRNTAPQPAPAPLSDPRITAIEQAIRDYHYALDCRKHGGVAEVQAFGAICNAMKMDWVQGQESERRAAIAAQGGKT